MRFCARYLYVAVLCVPALGAFCSEDKPAFDRGSDDDLKKGVVYKERTAAQQREAASKLRAKQKEKVAKSIQYHIKQLKSKDYLERATSAEYLGVLNAAIAIPDLIDCLRPNRQEKEAVMRAAHGALNKITNKNFGIKAYEEWVSWWQKEGKEFLKKAENELPEMDKNAGDYANTYGLELMRQGEHRQALEQFVVAIDKNPKVPDFHNNAGLALMNMGRYLDAIEYYNETIGLDPDLPQPYLNIGRTYSLLGKSPEAQYWFKQAIDKDKKGALWETIWMMGKEYMKRGEYKIAYEYLDQARNKAEKLHRRDPRLYNDIAICHYGLDQYHSAWKEICNVKYLGFEPNPDFVGKVRKVLKENGVDPDEEDELARKHMQTLLNGDDEAAKEEDQPEEKTLSDALKTK